jgi:polysaccharide export outer membrane protein
MALAFLGVRTAIGQPLQNGDRSNAGTSNTGAGGSPAGGTSATGAATIGKLPSALVQFRIGPGDILGVEVWKEPDASSPIAPVRPDGKISLSMIGEIQAAGLTPQGLEEALTAKYKEYMREPRVTVLIKEINSQKIYLIGEVKKEGPIRMDAPMTVLQALAQAGGVTDYGKRKKIYVLRTQQDQRVLLPFDLDAVVRGEKMEQNIVLAPGDTIVVPR